MQPKDKNDSIAVITPVYKSELEQEEFEAIRNNQSKLKEIDFYFAMPLSICEKYYYDNFPLIKHEIFPDRFFNGIHGYNKLMLNTEFYERFSKYRYILICQTDAWILKTAAEIFEFIDLGFDYYGAPWFPPQIISLIPMTNRFREIGCFINQLFPQQQISVGNGGLSLRNVVSTIKLLKHHQVLVKLWYHNEDWFYAYVSVYKDHSYKIAPAEVARRFALDSESYSIIVKGEIPFGVHAYIKNFSSSTNLLNIIRSL